MNTKIKTEIAVGIILILAVLLGGVVWLSSRNQPPAPAPVAQQNTAKPTQSASQAAAEQPVTVQQSPQIQSQKLQTGKVGATYANTDYGFSFTMPDAWMKNIGDYQVYVNPKDTIYIGDSTKQIASVSFAASATDKDWLNNQTEGFPKGYALLFTIDIIKKTDWDELQNSCAKESTPDCVPLSSKIGENDVNVFAAMTAQEGPTDFTMFATKNLGKDYSGFLNPIKSGFKLISQNQ